MMEVVVTVELNTEEITNLYNACYSYLRIDLTNKQLLQILEELPTDLISEINEFGLFDTATNDAVLDKICEILCGLSSPLYGSTEEYKNTYNIAFNLACKSKSIKQI